MAECTIRMVSNPKTGKRDIYIDFDSELDALPHEHEQDHRALAKRLLGDDLFDQDDIGQVVVSRGEPGEAIEQRDDLADQHGQRDKVAESQEG